MFPFALVDEAANSINQAASIITAASAVRAFDDVKFPVSLDSPDKTVSNMTTVLPYGLATDDTTIYQQASDPDNVSLEVWDGQFQAQKINVGAVGNKVKKVTLTLIRLGSASGELKAHIYSDSDGEVGTLIDSSAAVSISTVAASKTAITFTFATPVPISANTSYWIVLTSTGTSSDKVAWECRITGADATTPVSTKVGAGAWTNTTTKNFLYIVLGYYASGYMEVPFTLAAGNTYDHFYVSQTVDAHSAITTNIVNADTNEDIYTGLSDGNAISLDAALTPNLKFRIDFTRDASFGITVPTMSSIGLKGRAYESKHQLVDREFYPNQYYTPVLEPGLVRASGGLKLGSEANSILFDNFHPGYTDIRDIYVSSAGYILQRVYAPNAIKISALKIRYNGYGTFAILADNAGAPGTVLATQATGVNNSGFADKTFTLSTPIDIEAGTWFWVGMGSYVSTGFVSYYNTGYKGNNLFATQGVIFPVMGGATTSNKVSIPFTIYGQVIAAKVTATLEVPGALDHGLLYPIAYKPSGSTVAMNIIDPITNATMLSLADGEKCSLALVPYQLLSKIKVEISASQVLGSNGPFVGVCYNYTGAPIILEPRKRLIYLTFTASTLAAVGNYIAIIGKGYVVRWFTTGISATSNVYGDGHSLTVDDWSIGWRSFNTETVENRELYGNMQLVSGTVLNQGIPALMIPFKEKVSWDLTQKHTSSQNGGTLVIALEVDE